MNAHVERFESHGLRWNESKKLVIETRDSRADDPARYLFLDDDGELKPLVEKEESGAGGWPVHELAGGSSNFLVFDEGGALRPLQPNPMH